ESGAYNTYLNPGFPPSPICNPGLDAIRAGFAPEPSPYLFFVAAGDGSHAFAETFEEHQENIDRYLNNGEDGEEQGD
ncbi:MAG: endolytic transglycosylase MltG, partial [Chloroflexota bacterium]